MGAAVPIDVQEVFDVCDHNRSGYLDYLELQGAMRAYGFDATIEECVDLVRQHDLDADGKLNLVRRQSMQHADGSRRAPLRAAVHHHAPCDAPVRSC